MDLLDDQLAFALFCGVNTADEAAVADAVCEIERHLFPAEADAATIRTFFKETAAMFAGRFACFQAMDTPYHNFEHTLQATLVWAQITANYQRMANRMRISHEFFRIGLVAVLLHDIGYLKESEDEHGTGAKFTYVHERRSCELAHIYLNSLGWPQQDIFAVQHIISCTGPRAAMETIPFRHRLERVMGQIVCTADYLGQLADPTYLEKIPALFKEFEESDSYRGIPHHRRAFNDIESLYRGTEDFWHEQVLPRLNGECNGLYHLLEQNDGRDSGSAYVAAIEDNLRRVNLRAASSPS